MASPVDTFKNNLFGQLKSYGDVVQGVFEQRIARPLLALKRDLSRPSSTTHTPSDQESISPSFLTHEESVSASTSLEVIDIETNDSFKAILDKVKNTFSPSTKRRTSEISIDDTKIPTRESRHSSISSLSNKDPRKNRLRHHKSVSFSENIQYDDSSQNIHPYLIDKLADHSNMSSIDEKITHLPSSFEDNDENDFEHNFYQVIKPRRISIGNGRDLVYQDLSAEIVAYVLKHALRILEKEDEEFLLAENQKLMKKNEQNDEFFDLK